MKRKFLLSLIVIAISLIAFGAISASAVTLTSGYYTYSVSNSKAIIKDCEEYVSGEITIPSTLGGFPVTKIGASAFAGCSNLKRIIIHNSVTYIGGSAFSGCSRLESITIPNEVTSIGANAFSGCSSLESISIPRFVTSIGANAFSDCNLKKVSMYDIAAWCNISFDDSTANPLYYAHNLYLNGNPVSNLIIPDGVKNIGDYAFQGCNSLVSVTIPDSVTNIGNCAFDGCNNLADVYYDGTETDWINITIGSSNSCLTNAKIHFIPYTRTNCSSNDKSFTITPIGVGNGKIVILALYDGEKFVEMQSAVYTGEAIPFTTTKAYTKAKVFVWDDLKTLRPICEAEIVK